MDIQDYLDLIPPPNNIQPKFMEWLEKNFQPLIDSQTVINSMVEAFHIDEAVGDQLDVLGAILGLPRKVNFQPGGGASAILSDDFYRIALKAKIIQNQWKGTKNEIYDFWETFLPQYPVLILDNEDMSMSVLVAGMPNDLAGTKSFGYDAPDDEVGGYDEGYWEPFNGVLRDLVLNGYFTPKPAGVSVSYSFLEDPVFGYDLSSDLMKGYDEGEWISYS